jgi:hypothetical protein
MNKHATSYSKAQAMLEYILVMVVVVVIVFVAFNKNSTGVLKQTHDKAGQYFNAGSTAIMGGYWDDETKTYHKVEPTKINGGWCAWTTCIQGYKTRECACPRPAFGGKACDATSPNDNNGGGLTVSSAGCPAAGGAVSCSGCLPANEETCGVTTTDSCGNDCQEGTFCPAGWYCSYQQYTHCEKNP